jgi:hypothetical protein
MCRPAKRPKPLAFTAFVPLKAEELEIQPTEVEFSKGITSPSVDADVSAFTSLAELLEENSSDLFDLPITGEAETRPKIFVYTAYDMVNNMDNAQAVGFTQDGTALEIRDITLLSEKILPKYFRHKNVTSFYRQLNSYGFRTTRSASADIAHTFSHEMFKRGHPELLSTINRKKCTPKDKKTSPPSDETSEASPSIVGSPSSSSSSDASCLAAEKQQIVQVVAVQKPQHTKESTLEELRQTELASLARAAALEVRNRELAEENKSILMESEFIFETMNKLVENQTTAIGKLFGVDASRAFAEQAKPFRFVFDSGSDVNPDKPCDKPCDDPAQIQVQDEYVGENNDIFFLDEDLELLENIFTVDSSSTLEVSG